MRISDLSAVFAFVKIVELKSFRAAARALNAPASTLSRKIAELEDRLGVRLLERTTRTLRLTDAGDAYHRQVAPALEALSDAEGALADLQSTPTGLVRLSAPIEYGQLTLGGVVAEYLRRYPSMKVRVELTDRTVDLVEEGFDAALRPGPLPDSTLVARSLGRPERMRLYASGDYLRRRGVPRRPGDLVEHDCLVMSSMRQPTRWPFRDRRKRVTVEVKARAEVNSFRILRDLAVAGHGIARLPDNLGDRAQTGKLRTVLDDFVEPALEWHLLYPSARNASPKVRALLEVFTECSTAAQFGVEPSQ